MKSLRTSLLLILVLSITKLQATGSDKDGSEKVHDGPSRASGCVISLPDDLGTEEIEIKNTPVLLGEAGQILYPESGNKIIIDKGATIKLKCTSNLVRKSDKLNYIIIKKAEKPAYPIDVDFIKLKCQGGKKFIGKKFEPQEKIEKPKKSGKVCAKGKNQKPPKDEATRTKRADQGSSNDAHSEIEYLISDVTCTAYPKSTYIDKKNNEMCGTNKLKEIAFRISDQQTVGIIDICRIYDEKDLEYTAWTHSKIRPLISYAVRIRPAFSAIDSKIPDMNNLLKDVNADIRKFLGEYREDFEPQTIDRGHLIAKTDTYHPYEQFATFNYANVVPQWRLVNSDNWEMIEQIARSVTKNKNRVLDQWVGGFGIMEYANKVVALKKEMKGAKGWPVPLYTYKILLDNIPDRNDSNKKEGIVFITVNDPYLTVSECLPLVKCHDVLDHIPLEYFEDAGAEEDNPNTLDSKHPDELKKNKDRMKNPSHGYTFACTIEDFREAFPNNPLGVTFGQTKLMSIPDAN